MAADPTTAAQRWAANLGGATQKIQEGVDSVTVAPGQLAARNKAAYQQNTAANVDKWAARSAAVSLQEWQAAMKDKGVARIAGGATAAQAKMAAFLQQLIPFIERGRGTLPARGSFDQNVNRMTAWVRYMHGFNRSGR